jgi:arylsulfatase A-like enzyme
MPSAVRNILFVMFDQLRQDYLSCYGDSPVRTPHIDALAARGMRFDRAYAQGTSCGNSRASFYTGRHVRSHGATWNDVPFGVGEWTLADYMREQGLRTVLVGKTHMRPDSNGLERLELAPERGLGRRLAECGFDDGERDDGLHPQGPAGSYEPLSAYSSYLRSQGYDGPNPWLNWANSALDDDAHVVSGFFIENAHRASRVAAAHSETAYATQRAMDIIAECGERPWCMHLSYIKPHWPLLAPAPYHQAFGPDDVPKPKRSDAERADPHPVYAAFMDLRVSRAFSRDEVRQRAVPAYMGLVRQVDDEVGRLVAFLRAQGRLDDTLIVLTSDHGDYLGDHWLGEKDLFHDPSVRIPLIVVDPGSPAESRGRSCTALVGAIDILPTFIEALGGTPPRHRLEGFSLLPWLRASEPTRWREAVFSECDYARLPVRRALGTEALESRITMAFDGRWKMLHYLGYPPMLFDLQEDPHELHDLGRDSGYASARERMKDLLLEWSAGLRNRTALSDAQMEGLTGKSARQGMLIGYWSPSEVPPQLRFPTLAGVD